MLVMRLAIFLAECWRVPFSGGFAELDIQIDKLRLLRDSYKMDQQKPQLDTFYYR
jgi:hypothetical protein